MKNLPQDKLDEYKKLKQEIKRREGEKGKGKPTVQPADPKIAPEKTTTIPKNLTNRVTVSKTMTVQLKGGQRKVRTKALAKPGVVQLKSTGVKGTAMPAKKGVLAKSAQGQAKGLAKKNAVDSAKKATLSTGTGTSAVAVAKKEAKTKQEVRDLEAQLATERFVN